MSRRPPSYPPTDRLGRTYPRRVNWAGFARGTPGLLAQFDKEVPAEYFTRDVTEDGTPVAIIACPCREEPAVPVGGSFLCSCDRLYLATGEWVRVANLSGSTDSAEQPPTGVVD